MGQEQSAAAATAQAPKPGTLMARKEHAANKSGNSPEAKIKPRSNIVVIPVDDSKESEHAFNWYVRNSHREGNVLRLIHIHDTSMKTSKLLPDLKAVEINRDDYEIKRDHSANVISKFNRKLEDSQIVGSVSVEMGNPGLKIIDYANKHRASHIVMGRHGYGFIRRLVFGSVSQFVVDNSGIPVTVIPKETRSFLF